MDDQKDLVIEAHDKYGECLSDSVGRNFTKKERPDGYVEIYELTEDNKKQLLGKHNLVVNLGREWLLSHAFMTQNINIVPEYDEYICWFGVGDGGAPIGDPFNPTAPSNLDIELSNSIMINSEDASYGDYRTTPDFGYYKSPIDSFTFDQDPDNDNSWLIVRVAITLTVDDANGFNLNEAGLYTAKSAAGAYEGPFNLYARITFPTIVKSATRQLLFIWYVYF